MREHEANDPTHRRQALDGDDAASGSLSRRIQALEEHVAIVERQLDTALSFQHELRTVLTIVCGALDVVTEPDDGTR